MEPGVDASTSVKRIWERLSILQARNNSPTLTRKVWARSRLPIVRFISPRSKARPGPVKAALVCKDILVAFLACGSPLLVGAASAIRWVQDRLKGPGQTGNPVVSLGVLVESVVPDGQTGYEKFLRIGRQFQFSASCL